MLSSSFQEGLQDQVTHYPSCPSLLSSLLAERHTSASLILTLVVSLVPSYWRRPSPLGWSPSVWFSAEVSHDQSNSESVVSSAPAMATEISDSCCPGSRNCWDLSISTADSALTAWWGFSSGWSQAARIYGSYLWQFVHCLQLMCSSGQSVFQLSEWRTCSSPFLSNQTGLEWWCHRHSSGCSKVQTRARLSW